MPLTRSSVEALVVVCAMLLPVAPWARAEQLRLLPAFVEQGPGVEAMKTHREALGGAVTKIQAAIQVISNHDAPMAVYLEQVHGKAIPMLEDVSSQMQGALQTSVRVRASLNQRLRYHARPRTGRPLSKAGKAMLERALQRLRTRVQQQHDAALKLSGAQETFRVLVLRLYEVVELMIELRRMRGSAGDGAPDDAGVDLDAMTGSIRELTESLEKLEADVPPPPASPAVPSPAPSRGDGSR